MRLFSDFPTLLSLSFTLLSPRTFLTLFRALSINLLLQMVSGIKNKKTKKQKTKTHFLNSFLLIYFTAFLFALSQPQTLPHQQRVWEGEVERGREEWEEAEEERHSSRRRYRHHSRRHWHRHRIRSVNSVSIQTEKR
jgi:hypothetical protein